MSLLRVKTVRRRVTKATSVMVAAAMAFQTGCGGDFLGLEDYQRDFLFGIGSLAIALLGGGQTGPEGPEGPQGPPGPPG